MLVRLENALAVPVLATTRPQGVTLANVVRDLNGLLPDPVKVFSLPPQPLCFDVQLYVIVPVHRCFDGAGFILGEPYSLLATTSLEE